MKRKLLVSFLSIVTVLFFWQVGFSQNLLEKGNMARWTDTTRFMGIHLENNIQEATIIQRDATTAKHLKGINNLGQAINDTGISNNKLADTISIYPNPGNGKLNIVLNNTLKGNVTVRVMDMTGRVVYKHIFKDVMGQALPVDISREPSNLYFISINNGFNIIVKKFMKR